MQRLELIKSQVRQNLLNNVDKNSVSITDNRTGKLIYKLGKTYNFKLFDGALKASDIETIKDSNGKVLRSYDPAYMNTINCVLFILFRHPVFAI
jgi:hypothetical protein